MNAKHTPGPWTIFDHPTETCKVFGAGGTHVANVFCTDYGDGAANAELIAAAPDLAAALEAILASASPSATEHLAMFDAWAKGRTALRKAGRL